MVKAWIIIFGTIRRTFYTAYHAAQFTRALRLNGTEYTVETRE